MISTQDVGRCFSTILSLSSLLLLLLLLLFLCHISSGAAEILTSQRGGSLCGCAEEATKHLYVRRSATLGSHAQFSDPLTSQNHLPRRPAVARSICSVCPERARESHSALQPWSHLLLWFCASFTFTLTLRAFLETLLSKGTNNRYICPKESEPTIYP